MFEYIAYTTKGGKQDCIMVNATIKFEGQIKGKEEKKMFALVCNGIGDNDSGEKASGLAALEFSKFDIQNASAYSLNEYINRINKYIINMQKK